MKTLGAYTKKAAAAALIFLLLIFTESCFFENKAISCMNGIEAEAAAKDQSYASILYDNSNGLPTSEANAVAQSKEGFIWIGSYGGLIRYDSREFVTINEVDGLSSVVSLFVDSKDRMWIGSNDNGIFCYKDGEFTHIESEEPKNIQAFAEDKNGNIIVGSTGGLYYIGSDETVSSLAYPDQYINKLEADEDGTVWGITKSGLLFSVEDLQISAEYNCEKFGVSSLNCICPDKAGKIYIGTSDNEVVLYDIPKGAKKKYRVEDAKMINCIRKSNGKLWIASDLGVGYFDENMEYVSLKNEVSLDSSVDSITTDREDNIWFTSSRQGVMKLTTVRFTNINHLAGLPDLIANTTAIYNDKLYIGTDTGLVILKKDKNNRYTEQVTDPLTKKFNDVRIRDMMVDSRDQLWICTYNSEMGLVRTDSEGNITSFTEESGLYSQKVRCCTELSDGRIAVSSSGGVSIIEGDKVKEKYGAEEGISNTEILTLCDGGDEGLFLGSDGGGLYVIKDGKTENINTDEFLDSNVIMRIKKQPDTERYWLISSSSIGYMEDGVIKKVENFPFSNNFDLFFNKLNKVWVASGNGIYVADIDEMTSGEELHFDYYGRQSGLPTIATANSYSWVTAEGELYLAGTEAVISTDINEKNEVDDDIPLSVAYIVADGKTVLPDADGNFTVDSNTKRIVVYAYAMTYSFRDPWISYSLSGFDEDTTLISKRDLEPVTYTNLSGGDYVFHLAVVNANDDSELEFIDVRIHKRSAFYENIWFWIPVALLVIFLAIEITRYFMKKQIRELRKNQEKNRIFIDEMVRAFAKCVDMKDEYTNGHSARVAKYSVLLAKEMGLPKNKVDDIYNIAILHDIGKISVPDEILNKPARLTDEEYAIVKNHTTAGYEVLKNITIMPDLAVGAYYHHERYDGKGYPRGIKGEEIPKIAQIIALADSFDAMHSSRKYSGPQALENVITEIERCTGSQFAPDVAEAFLRIIKDHPEEWKAVSEIQ